MTTFTDQIASVCKSLEIPRPIAEGFLNYCTYYEKAVKTPPVDVFTTFLKTVAQHAKEPFYFAPYHKGIKEYYTLGLDFIRPLIDFEKSEVVGKDALRSIQHALDQKENVILLANHQTEIDPQVISLLIEKEYPHLAEKMIFVAGHRVTTDPLAVPLSLGRDLICIYSKRHMEEPPEKKAEKLKHNQKALSALDELLNEGGKCIYIAPSGGRDRKDENNEMQVAPFDPQSVEMFYLLSKKSTRPTHFHSLALLTYPLLPPPDAVLKEIGEERICYYSPAFLAFSPKIDMETIAHANEIQDKKEKRRLRAEAIWQQVASDYNKFRFEKITDTR